MDERDRAAGEVDLPRVPPALVGLLLLLAVILAIVFLVAAANVHTL